MTRPFVNRNSVIDAFRIRQFNSSAIRGGASSTVCTAVAIGPPELTTNTVRLGPSDVTIRRSAVSTRPRNAVQLSTSACSRFPVIHCCNSARNHLFGPGDIVFDVSVIKDTAITERLRTQFRAEFFNMPNHANFGNPGANISVAASLGRITSAGDPRQIQFGLKVLF